MTVACSSTLIVVLVGPHGAGKTTLGRALAEATGWPFHDEIGRRLAAEPSLRPEGLTAEGAQAAFDEAVFRAELERDRAWGHAHGGGATRIVETWHPGNLAYARHRSAEVALAWEAQLRAAFDGPTVAVVPLAASRAMLAARQSEPGDLEFFLRVGESASECARELGGTLMPVTRTDRESPARLAAELVPQLLRLDAQSAVGSQGGRRRRDAP